jgi:hypothetical protein
MIEASNRRHASEVYHKVTKAQYLKCKTYLPSVWVPILFEYRNDDNIWLHQPILTNEVNVERLLTAIADEGSSRLYITNSLCLVIVSMTALYLLSSPDVSLYLLTPVILLSIWATVCNHNHITSRKEVSSTLVHELKRLSTL